VDEFLKKTHGRILKKKPSFVAPRSDREGGKFNVTIFS
jgi:hypothetical protein